MALSAIEYLCLVILTRNEECHLSPVLGQRLYYYVHLDNLSDISAYGTVVKPQRTAVNNANPV